MDLIVWPEQYIMDPAKKVGGGSSMFGKKEFDSQTYGLVRSGSIQPIELAAFRGRPSLFLSKGLGLQRLIRFGAQDESKH